MLNKQIIEKDKVIDTLKKTICANEILIQTEKDKVDSAREELRNFKQEIEQLVSWNMRQCGFCQSVFQILSDKR